MSGAAFGLVCFLLLVVPWFIWCIWGGEWWCCLRHRPYWERRDFSGVIVCARCGELHFPKHRKAGRMA